VRIDTGLRRRGSPRTMLRLRRVRPRGDQMLHLRVSPYVAADPFLQLAIGLRLSGVLAQVLRPRRHTRRSRSGPARAPRRNLQEASRAAAHALAFGRHPCTEATLPSEDRVVAAVCPTVAAKANTLRGGQSLLALRELARGPSFTWAHQFAPALKNARIRWTMVLHFSEQRC
jgi:hypothetical protein